MKWFCVSTIHQLTAQQPQGTRVQEKQPNKSFPRTLSLPPQLCQWAPSYWEQAFAFTGNTELAWAPDPQTTFSKSAYYVSLNTSTNCILWYQEIINVYLEEKIWENKMHKLKTSPNLHKHNIFSSAFCSPGKQRKKKPLQFLHGEKWRPNPKYYGMKFVNTNKHFWKEMKYHFLVVLYTATEGEAGED